MSAVDPANTEQPRQPAFISAFAVLKPAINLLHALGMRASAAIAEKRGSTRRLRLLETVPLGEKRFVAILQVRGEQFLIGGGATGVCLLTRLQDEPDFSSVLAQQIPATVSEPAEGMGK